MPRGVQAELLRLDCAQGTAGVLTEMEIRVQQVWGPRFRISRRHPGGRDAAIR